MARLKAYETSLIFVSFIFRYTSSTSSSSRIYPDVIIFCLHGYDCYPSFHQLFLISIKIAYKLISSFQSFPSGISASTRVIKMIYDDDDDATSLLKALKTSHYKFSKTQPAHHSPQSPTYVPSSPALALLSHCYRHPGLLSFPPVPQCLPSLLTFHSLISP